MTPSDDRPVETVLAEFVQIVGREHDANDILRAVGDYCTELLPVHGIGVLLAEDGQLSVATANTEEGEVVERLEVELREGPCTRALATGTQVLCPDLREAVDEYPRFAPAALDAGVHAIHGLPMSNRMQTVGALNVISREPGTLSAGQLSTAQLLADVTIAFLANSQVLEEQQRLSSQLQHALDTRVVIEQAKGVLAERHGQPPSQAFERLRSHARRTRQSVRAAAEAVLDGRLDL